MGHHATIDPAAVYAPTGQRITPNRVQQWVLDAVLAASVVEVGLFGGFGSGKTLTGCAALLSLIWAAYDAWSGKATARANFALGSSDGTQLRTVTGATFEGMANAATGWEGPWWDSRRHHNPLVIDYSNDDHLYVLPWATITYATGHNAAQAIEGGQYTGLYGDEVMLWHGDGLWRWRRRHRQMDYPFRCRILGGTPQPGRSLQLISQWYGDMTDYQPSPLDPRDPAAGSKVRVSMPTRLNLAHLPADYVATLSDDCSPKMAAAILEGRFIQFGSLVYGDEYDDRNVVDLEPDPSRETIACWDTAYHRPYVGLLQPAPQLHPEAWAVVDELAGSKWTTEALWERVCNNPLAPTITTIYHDPAGSAVEETTGRSPVALARAVLRRRLGRIPRFVTLRRGTDDVAKAIQHETVRTRLVNYAGERRLGVARRLVGHRYGAGDDGFPVIGMDVGLRQAPLLQGTDEMDRSRKLDHLSHPCNAMEYLCQSRWPVQRIDRTAFREAFATELAAGQQRATGDGGKVRRLQF